VLTVHVYHVTHWYTSLIIVYEQNRRYQRILKHHKSITRDKAWTKTINKEKKTNNNQRE